MTHCYASHNVFMQAEECMELRKVEESDILEAQWLIIAGLVMVAHHHYIGDVIVQDIVQSFTVSCAAECQLRIIGDI